MSAPWYSRDHCCRTGEYLAMQDVVAGHVKYTEYGGRIDGVCVDTGKETVTYSGRTWQGILVQEDSVVRMTGRIISLLSETPMRCWDFDTAQWELVIWFVDNLSEKAWHHQSLLHQMDRYIDAYTGMRKMLKCAGAKLVMYYREGKGAFVCGTLCRIICSQDEEWDSDQMTFQISKDSRNGPANHLICLGKGSRDLRERMVRHLRYGCAGKYIRNTDVFRRG
ncbi:MAG: hypothetical protein ACLTDV_07480 [Eubacterium sp.]